MPVVCMDVICVNKFVSVNSSDNPYLETKPYFMCYHPITIINPCKYVSLHYRERYLLQVPCGHCAECATNKSYEWYFRSFYQSLDCLSSGKDNYIIFDTLTYRNRDLPHLSDFVTVPDGCDFPCFSTRHLQLFNKRLRKKIGKYGSHYSFFFTSEYGTSEKHTHRPHYHILIYSDGKIPPLLMSKYISDAWHYGRTDGIAYKSQYYVMNNVFYANNFAESLRTCRYVSKYVQKSCKFQTEISKRMDKIMMSIANKMIDGWLDSVHAKRVRQRYMRLMAQFHGQSKNYGASFMQNIDITDFKLLDEISMPDPDKVHLKISLPMYYKRKFFYEVVKIDGNDTWIPTALGQRYLSYRNIKLKENLANRLRAANAQANKRYDYNKLADYVLNYRGRIRAVNLPSDPLDKYIYATHYSYSTLSDREHLDNLGISTYYVGNNTIGYRSNKLYLRIKFKDFIDCYVIINDDYEKQLDELYKSYDSVADQRQNAYELRQHLTNLYHHLGMI